MSYTIVVESETTETRMDGKNQMVFVHYVDVFGKKMLIYAHHTPNGKVHRGFSSQKTAVKFLNEENAAGRPTVMTMSP
jgi:hypothetical protein